MGIGIHMASKNISITEDVYNKLIRAKKENESFSELFLRLLNIQRTAMNNTFGTWNLDENEISEIWGDITHRSGRTWKKPSIEKGME
jgi:predicted CopG family antitoxin